MENITVREGSIDVAVEICTTIVEFGDSFDRSYFEDRYQDKEKLILIGYMDERPAWFLVAYQKADDGSFYCWMTGVDPLFRRHWILAHLMAHLENWSRDHGYAKITIKTRNNRRAMLSYLVKSGFHFTHVETEGSSDESRIFLEKWLMG